MAKASGLGDNFYVGGYDLSGDTNSLSNVSGSVGVIELTSIADLAHTRIAGARTGVIDWISYWNSLGAHIPLSALPSTDVISTYARGTTLGSPAACCIGKQINYDPTRSTSGDLTMKVQLMSNGYGLEWGTQITGGLRTDTAATNGASVDQTTVSTAFGWQAYLQVTAFVGTDFTVTIQDSADNSSFANITSAVFTQVTAAPASQRLAVGGTAAVRRYVRAITTTSGGFTSATFNVVFMRNLTAVTF